jgi:hypothetical protein
MTCDDFDHREGKAPAAPQACFGSRKMPRCGRSLALPFLAHRKSFTSSTMKAGRSAEGEGRFAMPSAFKMTASDRPILRSRVVQFRIATLQNLGRVDRSKMTGQMY